MSTRSNPLVLLVDDEEAFLEIASMKLAAAGCAIVETHNAQEAFIKAHEAQPDLVLSDIYMPPGLNGWELAMALQDDPITRNIPITLFSSLNDPQAEFQGDQGRMTLLLRDITILSKTDDIDTLGELTIHMIKKN